MEVLFALFFIFRENINCLLILKPANKIEASSHLWYRWIHPAPSTSGTTCELNQFLRIQVPCIYIHHP